jgi:hypothetical protein
MPVTRSGHPGQNTSLARSQPGQRQAGPSESAGGRHEPSADVFSAYGLSTGRRSVAVRIDKRTLRRPDTGRSAPASWVSGNHPLRTRLRDVELATSGSLMKSAPDTCPRARAGMRAGGAGLAACVHQGSPARAASPSPWWLLRTASGDAITGKGAIAIVAKHSPAAGGRRDHSVAVSLVRRRSWPAIAFVALQSSRR